MTEYKWMPGMELEEDMRLIDADALRDSLGDEVNEHNQITSSSIAAIKYVIDAAPTVCCEDCRFDAVCEQMLVIERTDNGIGEYVPIDFCSRFERGEP